MRVQTKLFLAMLPTALVLVFVGIFVSRNMSMLSRHSEAILQDNFRSVLAVQRMGEAIERLDSAILFRFTRNVSESEKLVQTFLPVFEENLEVAEGNITEVGEKDVVRLLRDYWNNYRRMFFEIERLTSDVGAAAYHQRLYPQFLLVKNVTSQILHLNQQAMVRKSEQAQIQARNINRWTFMVIVLASLVGILVSVLLGRRTIHPLSILAQTARRIGTGDLAVRAQVTGTDEIAELAGDFNDMAERLQKIQQSSLGELLLAQQASQAAIDSIPDPIVILDADRRILNVNTAAEVDLEIQLQRPELLRAPLGVSEVGRSLERLCSHVLEGKGVVVPRGVDEAILTQTRNGEKYYLPRAAPLMDAGRIVGVTCAFQDVTRLRRFDQMKTDLVSTVAHEFRTPLTSLRMAIHLLLEKRIGSLREKQEDLLYAAREDCERLQSMVDDLLDVARIHEGRTVMNRVETSIDAVFAEIVDTHRLLAEKSAVTLSLCVPPEKVSLYVDVGRIQLVLKNLLSNALRHTPSGGRVEVLVEGDDRQITCSVSDSGQGIPREHLERVFEKFFRVPGTTGAGSGLGLAIAKEIVEAHGGRIGVRNNPDAGACFWFTIPRSDGSLVS